MEAAANRRFIHEVDIKREQLFADAEAKAKDEEEALVFCPRTNDHEADGRSSKEVIDISDDE